MSLFPDASTAGLDGAVIERGWFEAVRKTFIVIASAIVYYDYCLTFSREVNWVWLAPRRFSWLKVFFYINRYLTLFGLGGVLMRAFWARSTDPTSRLELCRALTSYHHFFGIVSQSVVAVFMIARVYALYDFDRRVLAFLALTAGGALVNGVICLSNARKATWTLESLPSSSCLLQSESSDLALRMALGWAGLLVFDIVIFLFTLWKTVREPNLGKSTIMQLLWRDGALYFAVMTLITVVTVASQFLPQTYLRGFTATLSYAVSSCLATRLILNMCDPQLSSRFTPIDDKNASPELSTVRWAGRDYIGQDFTFDLMAEDSHPTSHPTEGEGMDPSRAGPQNEQYPISYA